MRLVPKLQLLALAIFLSIVLPNPAIGQPSIHYRSVLTGITTPIDVAHAKDNSNHLFVVQQNGIIQVYDQAFTYIGDFLTVTGLASGGERGLLSMAFHPDYRNNGFFFVYYTNTAGNLEVARYKVSSNPTIADPSSKTIIITIPHPGQSNHNGGKLNFGVDGFLYFGTGDGGSGGDPPNNSQNGNSLLGKLIRIDINKTDGARNYAIPVDNPFVADPAVADEVYNLGLRNPWRWSFDRLTHDLWIGDVGQNAWEEVDFRKAGTTGGNNFGWRCYEGTHSYNLAACLPAANYVPPIFEYPHNNATGGFSLTGGLVYRGQEYPSLNGYYLCADYVSGNQWTIFPSDTGWVVTKLGGPLPANISSFGENESGDIFALSIASGIIYKLEVPSAVIFQLSDFSGNSKNGVVELTWNVSTETNIARYEIESSTDSIQFQKKGTVTAANQLNGASYLFDDNAPGAGTIFYRLKIFGSDGKWDYSKTITVVLKPGTKNFVYPSVITNGTLSVFVASGYDAIEIFSMHGASLYKKDIRGMTGRIDVPVSRLSKGVYLVKLSSGSVRMVQKVLLR